MKISKEARRFAREFLTVCMTDGRIDPKKITSYTDRLIAEKPRGYVQILKEFTRLVRLELEKRQAVVESAAELGESEISSLAAQLHGRFGKDITTEFRTNPSLLGGLRIRVGSDVWDGTVINRLQLLKQQL